MTSFHSWAFLNADRLSPRERTLIRWGKREEKRGGKGGVFLEGVKLAGLALERNLPLVAGWFTPTIAESHPSLVSQIKAT
ncbi:MAG: hypothetical protein ACK4OO_07575, partial [bacterium]